MCLLGLMLVSWLDDISILKLSFLVLLLPQLLFLTILLWLGSEFFFFFFWVPVDPMSICYHDHYCTALFLLYCNSFFYLPGQGLRLFLSYDALSIMVSMVNVKEMGDAT